jgi:thiol-disulfide isomerase/thioredoxin
MRWGVIFLVFGPAAFCQQLMEGKIVDADTGEPVSFASIGIIGTSKGTSSNLNGQFTLPIAGSVTLKITCVGYESKEISAKENIQLIKLKPSATQLNQIVIFSKAVNPDKIVRKAFAGISKNYVNQPFLQKFFYRHYCKDDSVYGRLIEAFVDVWKQDGYRSIQKSAGDKEQIRVTQIRRSLDNTVMAEGHEPIAVGNILQADIVGYQTPQRSQHISFYTDVSNLKTDFENYSFVFKGSTTYDGEDVYEISYTYKKDSVLTTSGKYLALTEISGLLYITMDTHAIIKTEEIKKYGPNYIRTSAYYRKYKDRYYPYQLSRDGENHHADKTSHSFHIDLMSVEMQTDITEKFMGREPGRAELLKIPYDSVFWSTNTILKTTPLELEIIRDLGKGNSLDKQFYLYRQYEMNISDGGKNGVEKFNWFKEDSRGKRIVYLFFWEGDCKPYLADVEFAKRLHKKYRNQVTFVFVSLNDDEIQWQQTVSKYNLTSDGIINYRIGKNTEIQKFFKVKEVPSFILISRNGEVSDFAKHPSNPLLEEDFKLLTEKSN